jgi:hypothetical protein
MENNAYPYPSCLSVTINRQYVHWEVHERLIHAVMPDAVFEQLGDNYYAKSPVSWSAQPAIISGMVDYPISVTDPLLSCTFMCEDCQRIPRSSARSVNRSKSRGIVKNERSAIPHLLPATDDRFGSKLPVTRSIDMTYFVGRSSSFGFHSATQNSTRSRTRSQIGISR